MADLGNKVPITEREEGMSKGIASGIQLEEWKKYGLEICSAVLDTLFYATRHNPSEYYRRVNEIYFCHCAVSSFLDGNPEIAEKYGKSGYRYFDILKIAAPKWYDKLDWEVLHDPNMQGL